MRSFLSVLLATIILVSCQPQPQTETNPGEEAFKRNSETVMSYLKSWAEESVDHSAYFAENYATMGTGFGEVDSIRLEQMIENDNGAWAAYDFEIVTDPLNLLPGVDVDTKKQDGSVRYYGEWRVTKPATDSTEAKSGNIRLYSAYVFNDEGKITLSLTYGDFTGILDHLNAE